jgi:carboxypeptidase PM20D1
VAVNTAGLGSVLVLVAPVHVAVAVDRAAAHLAASLAFPTVSFQGAASRDAEAFLGLHRHLETSFPKVHETLRREVIAEYSLLYTWTGRDPTLEPVLLMGHLDVVPVEPGTESRWRVPPFSGRIEDGFVWGRGALDDKLNVVAQLEAVEHLLERGWQPERSVMFAYGHDEEIGGKGAVAIASLLASRGVRLDLVVDEVAAIVVDNIDGLDVPAALIGVAEKGYVSVEIVARDDGGHSSMPPPHTTVGRVAMAVTRLEAAPMPGGLRGPTARMFDRLGPEMTLPMRIVFANRWLFGPVVNAVMSGKRSANAMLRTTTAATMFEGSAKENVLPSRSRAVVNFRILPGDTVQSVLEHVRETVDDPSLEVAMAGDISSEPSPISPMDSRGFLALERAIRAVFPEAVVAPYLVVGATDARHYTALTPNVYRFSAVVLGPTDLERIHGTDERVGVEAFGRLVGFTVELLRGAAGPTDAPP